LPKFLENALKKSAASKGFKGKRADRYVFGAMNNMGAMRGSAETPKGAAMQKKHDRKLTPTSAARIRKKASQISGY